MEKLAAGTGVNAACEQLFLFLRFHVGGQCKIPPF